MTGKFITLEGGEGAGKSTQAALLGARLSALGVPNIVTREPGGSILAEVLRRDIIENQWSPLSEVFLFLAARNEHLKQTIRPALAAGTWVICDRFADSSLAYQGYGRDPTLLSYIDNLNKDVIKSTQPNLTIVLDVDPKVVLLDRKLKGTEVNRFEMESWEFHERVRAGFLEIARMNRKRCVVLDAHDAPSVVQSFIWTAIGDRFPDLDARLR